MFQKVDWALIVFAGAIATIGLLIALSSGGVEGITPEDLANPPAANEGSKADKSANDTFRENFSR